MRYAIALFSVLLANICSVAHAGPGNDKVQVETVADTSPIVPGKPFNLGIKFAISPGWHIYWKNPGDSGLPTQVKLNLPEGFTAGNLMYPVPSRLELPGDIINYAYENEVMLMVQITPPKDLPIGKSVSISGKASWLVCQDSCIAGKADLLLDLSVAPSSSPANVELFKRWSSQLPVREDPDDIMSISHTLARDVGANRAQVAIDIRWKKMPSDAIFIPQPVLPGKIDDLKVSTQDESTKITFVATDFMGHETIMGLLVFPSATGSRTGVEISLPGNVTRN
jgi:DsbC/DsbD-like thiol-disulfide interchange protein